MQRAMDTLDGLLRRHKRAVVLAWLVAIVAAAPFTARQTDHLSSGGFGVKGSGSQMVDDNLHRFPGVSHDQLAVVLRTRDPRKVAPALDRLERLVARRRYVELTPPAKRAALAHAREPIV